MAESNKRDKEQEEKKRREKLRPASLLSSAQRRWLTVALLLAALLLANTLYLVVNRVAGRMPGAVAGYFAFSPQTIPKFFQVMVLSHTGLGVLVAAMFIVFGAWHLPKVWRRHRPRTVFTGALFVTCGLVLLISGPFILHAAASRQNAWVWWTHVMAGALVPLAYLAHRLVSYVPAQRSHVQRFGTLTVAGLLVMIVGHGFTHRGPQRTLEARLAAEKGTYDGPGSKARDLARFAASPFVSASFVPSQSPFFPSAATTTTGDYLPERIITRGDTSSLDKLTRDLDEFGFAVNQKIGADTCGRCHADIVEQWSRSAHRFASFNNPFYEATINNMRQEAKSITRGVANHVTHYPHWTSRTAEIKSKWCSGCHDPAVMLAGQMTEDIDRRSPQAQAGLTCLACHAIDKIHNTTGNGNYNIADEQEDPYLFAGAPAGTWKAWVHDTAIKAKPEAHKQQMLKPFFRSSEFCGTCHKVSLQEPVNDYRWFRGQNEYDNWHDSGVAHNAARTFYLPPQSKTCQECHMPLEEAVHGDFAAKDGKVRSHRFLAVNTALPYLRGDAETIERIEAFLRDEKLRIDVFALTREARSEPASTSPEGAMDDLRSTLMGLGDVQPSLRPGETVGIDVVVRNKGVGHTFPGGTNDSNESWIEFTVLDSSVNVVAQSGFVGNDGFVDPSAHYFRAVVVDRHSQAIRRRNAQDMVAPVYMNVIGPGTAHTVHYEFKVPEGLGDGLTVRARLLWRKFDRAYTEFAFQNNREGFKRFSECPDLPITEICRSEVSLEVVDQAHRVQTGDSVNDLPPLESWTPFKPDSWVRFNDYGIGLLLQGDTKGASRAFAEVARLRPDLIDGPRNLARVAIQDGDLKSAYPHLEACEMLISNDPQTAWLWGVLLQEDGRYEEAVAAYRRTLQAFPKDRAAWRNLGTSLYRDDRYAEAIDAFNEVLAIDPEDRVAHYHLMLCHRVLGHETEARTSEEAYLFFKPDDSQAEVTQRYRLDNPHDNHESQPIHVHEVTAYPHSAETMAGVVKP